MADEDWWSKLTTRLGDVFAGPPNPFGALMPGMPQPDRNTQIGMGLLTLGSALSQGGRQRLPIGESLGAGFQGIQQGGTERMKSQLQMGLLGQRIQEGQRKNQTMEMLSRTKPPPGVDPDVWRGMVMSDPGHAFKLYIEAAKDDRIGQAYGAGGGTTPAGGGTGGGTGTTAGGGHPQEYEHNIGNLVTTPTAWAGKGDPYKHPNGLTFETFSDPTAGAAAAYKNIQYHVGKGATTFAQLGRRVLGVPDTFSGNMQTGDNPDVWASAVSRAAGLKPTDPIPINDPQAMARVLRGVNVIEKGRPTVPEDAYLAGITGRQIAAPQAPQGTAQPPLPDPNVPTYAANKDARTAAAGPPQGPSANAQVDYRNDPGLQLLQRSRQSAVQARQWDKISTIDAAIAARMGHLTDQTRSGPELVEVWDPRTQQVTRVPRAQAAGMATPEQERLRISRESEARQIEAHRADGSLTEVDGRRIWRNKIGGQTTDLGPVDSPIDRKKLDLLVQADQRAADAQRTQAANQKVIVNPDGTTTVNKPLVEADAAVAGATGREAALINRDTDLIKGLNAAGMARLDESLKKASAAASSIPIFHEALGLIDKGMITGTGADWRVSLGNVLSTLGWNESDSLANTRAYLTVVGRNIGALAREVGGTQISNFDAKTAERLAAGDINIDEKSLRSMLMAGDRMARVHISGHAKLIEPLLKDQRRDPTASTLLSVEMPPAYVSPAKPQPAAQPAPQQPGQQPPGRTMRFDSRGREIQ